MKIKLDFEKVLKYGEKKGDRSLRQICKNSGVSECAIRENKSRKRGISLENAWLLAEYFDCHIEDIVYADWGT